VYIFAELNARHGTLGSTSNNTTGKAVNVFMELNKCTHVDRRFPTYILHNSATTPDIVLTNTKTIDNIHVKPGLITPCDHVPIIATISAHPIHIEMKPRLSQLTKSSGRRVQERNFKHNSCINLL
jgi:hypothetical protein